MRLIDRIGIDVGRRLALEEAVPWAARHAVRHIDIELDTGSNVLSALDQARGSAIRAACERRGVALALHTSSAVNVADYAPYVGDAVERYLEAYVEAAAALAARWVVVHAGFHFTSDKALRMETGRERLRRVAGRAERLGVAILLENLNKEPEDAEIHYLAHTLDEWRFYFEAIQSPALRLSFTANHAHLVPEGIAGFVDGIDMRRVAEVRLADCLRNGVEAHLRPGEGDLDFGDLFRRVEGSGFAGLYTNAFGSLDDMLAAREHLVAAARAAGVATE
jgi:sugar phosphate isomerase/epimerase